MSARSIRRQLDAIRAGLAAGAPSVDWDALGAGDWPAFAASLPDGPPTPEQQTRNEEARHRREFLARVCTELGCQPAELGMPDPASPQPPSGFVSVPHPEGEQPR